VASKINVIYAKNVNLLYIRGWVSGLGEPRLARVRIARKNVLAVAEVWYDRPDISNHQIGMAQGFTITRIVKLSSAELSKLTIDIIGDSGVAEELTELNIVESDGFEFLPERSGGMAGSESPGKQLLNLVAGEASWMERLFRDPAMRQIVLSSRKSLLADVLASGSSKELLQEVAEQLSDSDRSALIDELLVDHRAGKEAIAIEGTGLLEEDRPADFRTSFDKFLVRLSQNTLEDGDLSILGTMLSASLQGEESLKGLMEQSPDLVDGMARIVSKADPGSTGLALHASTANGRLVAAALKNWENGKSFDEALVLAVFQSSAFGDILSNNPRVATALSKNHAAVDGLAGLPELENEVLRRNEMPRLAPITSKRIPIDSLEIGVPDGFYSIVLGVYNGEEFLQETLDSVAAQSVASYEFIIVDDCSSDGTSKILRALQRSDKRVKVIRHKVNLGQAAAFNTGIAHATGKYVAFLDADDLWASEKLETCHRFISSHEDIEFCQHNLKILNGDWKTEKLFRATLSSGDYVQQMLEQKVIIPGPFSPTSGLVVSKQLLEKIGEIPVCLRVCADGFMTRAAAALTNIASLPVPLGFYRLHGSNATIGNEMHDGANYTKSMIVPLIQEYYDHLELDIVLPGYKRNSRKYTFQIDRHRRKFSNDFDRRIVEIIRFVNFGVLPAVKFSQPMLRFLQGYRKLASESDLPAIMDRLFSNKLLPFEDRRLAICFEVWFWAQIGDWNRILTIGLPLADDLPFSAVLNGLCSQAALKMAKHEVYDNLTLKAVRTGTWTRPQIERASRVELVERDPQRYLTTQCAALENQGKSTEYFDAGQWTSETVPIIDAWSNETRDGRAANVFACRYLKPSEPIREAIDSLATTDKDEPIDWGQASALDVAGASVFCGEWFVRTADAYCMVDALTGTPHHYPSAYGNVAQRGTTAKLVYGADVKRIGPSVLVGGDDNYFHWIHDTMPRALWYKSDPNLKYMKALIARPKHRYQKEIISAVDIPSKSTQFTDYPEVLQADRLVIPLLGPQAQAMRPVYGPIRKWAHDKFGQQIFENWATDGWKEYENGNKIYVVRGSVNHRGIINEDAVISFFSGQGFIIVDPAQHTVAEQVEIFNEASVVVGAHGAGLANLCFCRPMTRVVELAFAGWCPQYFGAVAAGRGLRYQRLFMRTVDRPDESGRFSDAFISDELMSISAQAVRTPWTNESEGA
jgi:glycosyltransferase involved in cell wall biosynthesis